MTTPNTIDQINEGIPYTIPLIVVWNDPIINVQQGYRDTSASDPVHRFVIPPGETKLSVTVTRSRFLPTVVLIPKEGGEITLGQAQLGKATVFSIGAREAVEVELRLGASPNTNDRVISQIAVTVLPFMRFKPPS